jgi:hypothetical protein
MKYIENCKQHIHPFDFETFSLLLNTDIWAYLNLIPQKLMNRYLNDKGSDCFLDKFQAYPFEYSEYETRSILGSRFERLRYNGLLSLETAHHFQIGRTTALIVRVNGSVRCFLSLLKVKQVPL